ncbi:hypothetical protein [Micromonospora chokoriensis]|uniref:hypothetical protein n=1 Tax=Micromonospora chokoriensis TaxID=356851 RepID=UPI0004C3FFE1|nr:hypothetical protein [Micromonospora chokoriensis]
MTGTDESARPVDRFESARLTVLQHVDRRTCFHCSDDECQQHIWAVEELTRHAGGRRLLSRLGLLPAANHSLPEGQPR